MKKTLATLSILALLTSAVWGTEPPPYERVTIDDNTAADTVVETIDRMTDMDGYILSGADSQYFMLSGNQIKLKQSLLYDNPLDENKDNTYILKLLKKLPDEFAYSNRRDRYNAPQNGEKRQPAIYGDELRGVMLQNGKCRYKYQNYNGASNDFDCPNVASGYLIDVVTNDYNVIFLTKDGKLLADKYNGGKYVDNFPTDIKVAKMYNVDQVLTTEGRMMIAEYNGKYERKEIPDVNESSIIVRGAAIKKDGSLRSVASNTPKDRGYVKLYESKRHNTGRPSSRVALKVDGTLSCFGYSKYCTNAPASVGPNAKIYTNGAARVALKEDGSLAVWGDQEYGGVAEREQVDAIRGNDFVQVYISNAFSKEQKGRRADGLYYKKGVGFIARKSDGSLTWWGAEVDPIYLNALSETGVTLYNDGRLKIYDDGHIVSTGSLSYGGKLNHQKIQSDVEAALPYGIQDIFVIDGGYMIIRQDGEVIIAGDYKDYDRSYYHNHFFDKYDPIPDRTADMGTFAISIQKNVPSHTITFDPNTGTGTMRNMTCAENTSCALLPNECTKTDYTFLGRNTAPDGSGTGYINNDSVTLSSTGLILYAQRKQTVFRASATFTGSDTFTPQCATGRSAPELTLTHTETAMNVTGSTLTGAQQNAEKLAQELVKDYLTTNDRKTAGQKQADDTCTQAVFTGSATVTGSQIFTPKCTDDRIAKPVTYETEKTLTATGATLEEAKMNAEKLAKDAVNEDIQKNGQSYADLAGICTKKESPLPPIPELPHTGAEW